MNGAVCPLVGTTPWWIIAYWVWAAIGIGLIALGSALLRGRRPEPFTLTKEEAVKVLQVGWGAWDEQPEIENRLRDFIYNRSDNA